MKNEIVLSSDTLLNWDFKLDARGYFDKAEEHFEAFKDTSLPLPIWYQDRLTKWKSGKLILQGKGYACITTEDPANPHGFPFKRFDPRGPPAFKMEMKQQEPQKKKFQYGLCLL